MEDDAPFDGGSMLIRRKIEATLHEYVAKRFVSSRAGWIIVSSASPSQAGLTSQIEAACESIYRCFECGIEFLRDLSNASSWNLVVFDYRPPPQDEPQFDVGKVLEEIEMSLFEWLTSVLKTEYVDRWWTDGIPQPIRVACATRREEEGQSESLPSEAYLMLIDFREIVRKNWALCGKFVEEIAQEQGKDRATHWIVELNEMRKLWAHPVKQRFRPVDASRVFQLKVLRERITAELRRGKQTR